MKKLVSVFMTVCFILGSCLSASAYSLEGGKWAETPISYKDNSNSSYYTSRWETAATNWNSSCGYGLQLTTNSVGLTTNTTSESSADWDGITYYSFNPLNGHFTYANAYLNTYYTNQSKYTTDIINGIATHEMGHALGLGHNNSASSVMYPYTFVNGECIRSNTPSDTDMCAMRSLYGTIILARNTFNSATKSNLLFSTSSNIIKNKMSSKFKVDLSCKKYQVAQPSWSVKYTSIEDLAAHSDLIVEGIISKENGTVYDTKGNYNTYRTETSMSISKIIKCNDSMNNSNIRINQLGGRDDDTQIISQVTTPLIKTNKVLIFLKKDSDNTYHPINEDEGIYLQKSNGKFVNIGFQQSQQYSEDNIIQNIKK